MPYEYKLYLRCQKRKTLPLAGGELDQPHILMHCFDIIEDESIRYQLDRKKREEANKRLKETHKNAVSSPKS